MDLNSWDWGTIAPFITGLIALFIYYQWRNKKRSEIMSNEAAKILILLGEYRDNLSHLDSEMMKPTENDNTAKLEELKLVTRQLCRSAISFSGLASNERTIALQIKDIAAKFYNEAKRLDLDKKSFLEIRKDPNSPILVSEFNNAIEKPESIIINYFKYQGFRLILKRWVRTTTTKYSKLKKQCPRG